MLLLDSNSSTLNEIQFHDHDPMIQDSTSVFADKVNSVDV